MEGQMIPTQYTCAGTDISPPLAWTAGPGATQSYAIVFTDKSNNFRHWAIFDIPATVMSLPENVERAANPAEPAGAKQVKSFDNQFGYAGPCPGGNQHTYEFVLYALDVPTITPAVDTSSSLQQVEQEVQMHDIATASLSGTSDAQP
jgi:Raf kinase inhibitor-like YbhB/YbcL family protein